MAQRDDKTLNAILLAAAAALAIGYFGPRHFGDRHFGDRPPLASTLPSASTAQANAPAQVLAPAASPAKAEPARAATASASVMWAAAAPGRVEPNGGEIRMSAQAGGRIAEILVAVGDRVQANDLLLRLDDQDLEARVAAAESEASVRRRERDPETVAKAAADRRTNEDAVTAAELKWHQTRAEFDRLTRTRRAGASTVEDLGKAREAMTAARDKLDQARTALRRYLTVNNLPNQTRLEAGLAAARSDLTLADAALERARLRAPRDATVLQVIATAGETAAPSPDNVLLVLGDISSLRVRAEIEERDAGKIRIGHDAVVRSDAFPGKDFEGKIVSMARSLGSGRLTAKGPRKPNDLDVLEVMIDLGRDTPLLSGMRVDVFVKPEKAAGN